MEGPDYILYALIAVVLYYIYKSRNEYMEPINENNEKTVTFRDPLESIEMIPNNATNKQLEGKTPEHIFGHSINDSSIAFNVYSTGNTFKKDFHIDVRKTNGQYECTLYRLVLDNGEEEQIGGDIIVWELEELGIPEGAPIIVTNKQG